MIDRRSPRRAGGARSAPAPGPGLAGLPAPSPGCRAAAAPDEDALDVAIVGGGMAGLALLATLAQLGLQARIFDRSPGRLRGPLGHDRTDGDPAFAQGTHRPRAGLACADLPRLVRGPIRAGGLGRAGQDPAPAMGRLSALVPQRAGPGRAQRQRVRPVLRAPMAWCSWTWWMDGRGRAYSVWRATWCWPPAATAWAGLGARMGAALPRDRWAHSSDNGMAIVCGAGAWPSSAAARRRWMPRASRSKRRAAGRPADPAARSAAHQQGQGGGQPGMAHGFWACPTNGSGASVTTSTCSRCRRRTAARCACRAMRTRSSISARRCVRSRSVPMARCVWTPPRARWRPTC